MTPGPLLLLSQGGGSPGSPLGSGIRMLELARALRADREVTLALTGPAPAEIDGIPCVSFHPHDPTGLAASLRTAAAVVSAPRWPRVMRALRNSDARLVFDLYDPEPLALIPGFPGARPVLRRTLTAFSIDRTAEALAIGQQFVCASERQRDFWLGAMLTERLLGQPRYDADPSLRSLIDVVPFGLPAEGPARGGPGPRERFAQIAPRDEIVLWNGGLWPWLDAETPIRAVAALAERRPVRLVFMGAAGAMPSDRATDRARELAASLGALDRCVFFNDRWVPYGERAGWLEQAACVVSAHADQLETRLSFRTRLLDCLWAGLPVVCTEGDELGELVDRERLGAAVVPQDAAALEAALVRVLDAGRAAHAQAFERVRPRFAWSRVVAPLERMLAAPPPPPAPGRRPGGAQAARRAAYLSGRAVLDRVGVRDWPRV